MSTFFETLTVNDAHLANNNRPRQRITRACDQCHELRTRCNGKKPCSRCSELSTIRCEYNRRPKKRGKASGRLIQSPHLNRESSKDPETAPLSGDSVTSNEERQGHGLSSALEGSSNLPRSAPTPDALRDQSYVNNDFELMESINPPSNEIQSHEILPSMDVGHLSTPDSNSLRTSHFHGLQSSAGFKLPQQMPTGELDYHSMPSGVTLGNFGSISSPQGSDNSGLENFLQGTPFPGGVGQHRNAAMWQSKQSPQPFSLDKEHGSLIAADMKMKYAVLTPLMPHLINIISLSLANELLEYYFATFSGSTTHPLSPYIQTFILRKNSVLHSIHPRRCSPGLLCSMLWLAAQTCEAPALTDGPTSRARISQKLLDLTMDLLKPLRHHLEGPGKGSNLREDERMRDHTYTSSPVSGPPTGSEKPLKASSNIDNLITYIHLGTVFSASEHKASSIRWWSVAWSMARDMRLNREMPQTDDDKEKDDAQGNSSFSELRSSVHSPSRDTSQEEREERRRIWWLLYMCDRHLSLCYNQPLYITDIECETLLQPLDERIWQNARIDDLEQILSNTEGRPRGPQTKCFNLSLFGYFLPLMTILGGIIDLIRARTHPRFGRYSKANPFWDEMASDISAQLDDYYYTLEQLGGGHVQMDRAEDALQQRIAFAYGSHIMHVMHILLSGKWDPIVLLEDEDHWVGTQSFVMTTKHATSAAEVIPSIFDNDLDLSFMPWYWGIYLLHGSFLLLFVADKLQHQTTPSVLGACQSIIRAHEACAVTLDNEYQRNFRKIMISAVAQIKGRRTEDSFILQQRRREVLSLYRWVGGGSGLAL